MKILQLGKFYPIKGGVEKVMYEIMLGLSRRSIDCDMLCAVTECQTPGIIQINEFARLFCMPAWIRLAGTMISPLIIFRLRKIHREYDIVHIHHPDPMACAALYFSGYKGKVILHWHSDILKQRTLLKFYQPLQAWLIDRADVIVGTTPVYVRQSPFLRQVQNKIISIPIGVDKMVPVARSVSQIREKYAGKKIVFSLGRLVEYKGYEYLIRVAPYLSDDYVILIGGSGPLKEELQALIVEQKAAGKVELIGFVSDDDLPNYYEACDLFCLSSVMKTEAFAIVQIEAMSFGKPVVATRIKESGVSWVNAHGVSGLNAEPRDAGALAEAITSVLSDQHRYKQFSAGAYERYTTLFTKEIMIDKCVKVYDRVLQVDKQESHLAEMDHLNRRRVLMPGNLFFKEVKALLDIKKRVCINVCGESMRPFLQNGDQVLLASADPGNVRRGNIVLAQTSCGIVLHRIVQLDREAILLAGDANAKQREQTVLKDILGVVTTAHRNGKDLGLYSLKKRLAALFWYAVRPFRGYLLKIAC